MRPSHLSSRLTVAALAAGVAACSTPEPLPPVAVVPYVELPRYMGDWYVIASIPGEADQDAHNAKASYRLQPDGSIATSYTFNAGAPTGALRTIASRATVEDTVSHAVWGQQFEPPLPARSDYRISWLASDYGEVVVTRQRRDAVWIMARTPTIPDPDYAVLAAFVAAQGYDGRKLQKVPQAAR